MKKILFTTLLAIIATNINAQLLVDSLGRVGIATDSVKSMLGIGAATREQESVLVVCR